MDIQIKVINVGPVENVSKGRNNYSKFDLTYKDLGNGKVTGKQIMSFGNSDVYNTLKNAKQDDTFTVTIEKNSKTGYWDWLSISYGLDVNTSKEKVAPDSKQTAVPRSNSNYETAEERRIKQRSIERQSSLAQAVAYHADDKQKAPVQSVLATAEQFYTWVQGNPNQPLLDLENDVPQ